MPLAELVAPLDWNVLSTMTNLIIITILIITASCTNNERIENSVTNIDFKNDWKYEHAVRLFQNRGYLDSLELLNEIIEDSNSDSKIVKKTFLLKTKIEDNLAFNRKYGRPINKYGFPDEEWEWSLDKKQ